MMRWDIDGVTFVKIHCGCCAKFFVEPLGGSALCSDCINGAHENCHLLEIMGIKK